MNRASLLALLLLFASCQVTTAQDNAFRDDIRFVEALRDRGDNDLALEFLQRIAKGVSPSVQKELSLELARTRMRLAADEPETSRRLAQYRAAGDDLRRFIADNPGHPKLLEASLDIARVLNLQGKAELNQAILAEDSKSRRELAQQSRNTLAEAGKSLLAAGKALASAKLPDPETITDPKLKREAEQARIRVDNDVKQTELDRALNLYDQASGYILINNDNAASKLLIDAKKLLEPLDQGAENQPITWKARAWLGRVIDETETTDKAHVKFLQVTNSSLAAAADGVRLAEYFRLKVIREKPRDQDRAKGVGGIVINGGRKWREDYRRYRKTPEGFGMTFLLASTLVDEAAQNKKLTGGLAAEYRRQARMLISELENSENEFTERARRLKINLMKLQGLFDKPIAQLKGFEDCYVRAQFEAMQLSQELGEIRDPERAEIQRKVRGGNILTALDRALADPELKKGKPGLELNTAKSMYAYWSLNLGKLPEAIKVGERFAREDPRSTQAEMSAVYALQAYSQLVGQKLAKFDEDAQDFRARMFSLAGYMEERWPGTLACNLARHSVGLQLLREENFREAIKKLSLITPEYANYTLVCFQIADACSKAEGGSIEPIAGDRPGDYRKRAFQALSNMPDSALGDDPFTNQILISGKARLGRDLFRFARFQQMDDLASSYLTRLDKLRFGDTTEKDQAVRNQLRFELIDVKLYARYGLANAAFQAANHARVLELIDPLVVAAKSKQSQERSNLEKNKQLSSGLLTTALRSSVQLGKIDRTEAILGVLEEVSGEASGGTNTLRFLAFLIKTQVDELTKSGDKEALKKAVDGYTSLMQKRTAKARPGLELNRVLAECYSSMGKHTEAAGVLEKISDPKAKSGSEEEKQYRAAQIILVREYRLSKDKDKIKKGRALLQSILGSDKKPGWGQRDLPALMEDARLLQAEEKHSEAYDAWGKLVARIQPNINRSPALKDRFLECYFHMIESYYRVGQSRSSTAERDKYTTGAARQLASIRKDWGDDFGNDAMKKRVEEFLSAEPTLKKQFESLMKK